jgi:hypothetical protein
MSDMPMDLAHFLPAAITAPRCGFAQVISAICIKLLARKSDGYRNQLGGVCGHNAVAGKSGDEGSKPKGRTPQRLRILWDFNCWISGPFVCDKYL